MMGLASLGLTRAAIRIALIIFGLSFMVMSYGYGLGTPINFGPGFFPFLFAGMLVVTTAVEFVQTARAGRASRSLGFDLRRVLCMCLSLTAFGLLLGPAGFVPAVFVATLLAMLAERDVTWLTMLVYALALSAVSYVVFIVILGIPVTAFG